MFEEEIWKDIKGYEGFYQVSNKGRIRRNNKILKNVCINDAYFVITLSKNKKCKRYLVHRLVAENFIDNFNNYPIVNHIDGNKQNNCVDNLEWCTYSMNEKHAYNNGLKSKFLYKRKGENAIHSKKIKQFNLNNELIKIWNCINYASNELGILQTSISNCLKGRSKTAGGFKWKYYDNN